LPAEVQQTIAVRLAEKALQPQVLVIVRKSAANTVTVLLSESGEASSGATGETPVASPISNVSNAAPAAAVTASARVPLSPGGDRLLQVIAAAGGAKAPVHETFVQLSRGGVTARIPMQQLVSDPSEDIFAQPGTC
jgi:polysaccharide export outer membrane protein